MNSQPTTSWKFPVLLTTAAFGTLVFLQVLCTSKGIAFAALVRDPAVELKGPAYVGLLSNLGGVGWGSAVTLAAFGWARLRHEPTQAELARLLLHLALFTALLGLDDIALLHDEWLPRLRLSEKILIPIYGGLALLWLRRYHRILRARVPVSLALAIGCFTLSVLFDQRPQWGHSVHHLLEDGFKILGILNWTRMTYELVAEALTPLKAQA